jgi:signal transduction histidine kinase
MTVGRRLQSLPHMFGFHRPRWTVRTKLTLLYSFVFLLCGAALLGITYLLVDHSTANAEFSTGNGAPATKGNLSQHSFSSSGIAHQVGNLPSPAPQLRSLVSQIQTADLHQLLVKSVIALAIMAGIAVAAGYLVATRSLRPLRSVTATARGISAANLHQRLAMGGPDDELKELGDTFDQLLARLESSFAAQRQFVANASHELRSPLTRLRLLAEVAATDRDATIQSLQLAYQRVAAASLQQEQLIDALLVLAKSQGGIVDRATLDLAELVENVLSVARDDPSTPEVDTETRLEPAPISGDRRLIERLVTNLVDNAVRYNVTGGVVQTGTGCDDRGCYLVIANDGPVISPTELPRLFKPFERLEAGRRHHQRGHGLGLSIVEAIADAHGAIIAASSRPAGGLQIEVRFPAQQIGILGSTRQ